MGRQVVAHELPTTGSPADVYALLIDGSTWPEWSPIGSFELKGRAPARRKAWAQCGSSPPVGSGVGSSWWWRSRMSSSAT